MSMHLPYQANGFTKPAEDPTGCATSYTSQAKVLQMVLCCPQGFGAEVALLVGRQKTSGEERQMLWEVGT